MKLLSKTIIFILLVAFSALAQKQKTDREVDGFRGLVKTVLTERATLKKGSRNLAETKRKSEEAITYDKTGNRLTWKTYDFLTGTLFESVVYSRKSGDKIAVYEEVENSNKITATISASNDEPVTSSNSRYSQILKYKFDDNGNVSEEAWYQSDGSLWMRYTYKIKGNQKEELVCTKDGSLNQKYLSTIDDNGNEIEQLFYDTEKDTIDGKETYKYLEFDSKGNWTKKITSEGDEESRFVVKPREVIYRTITYF